MLRTASSQISSAVLLLAVTLAVSTVGFGAEVEPDPQTIEEVIVTARKHKQERLLDVPISMTVFTEDDLHRLSVQDLADIQYQTPNLLITPFPAVSADASISMRGQNQFEPVITLDPAIGIYIDGVYLGRSAGALLNLVDLERVEILMGPQGTLYGRNTTGGVINLITNKPGNTRDGSESSDYKPFGSIDVLAGEHGTLNITGMIDFALSDSIDARVSYRNARRNGYGRNTFAREDLDDESADVWRASVRWRPSDTFELLMTWDQTRQREHSRLFHVLKIDPDALDPTCLEEAPPALGCLINFLITDGQWANVLDGDERKIRSDIQSTHDLDVDGVSLTIDQSFRNFKLRSITGYREVQRININDIDGSEWPILHPDAEADQRQFSQEIQLYGDRKALTWLAGIFYFDEEGNDNTIVTAIPALNPASPSTILPHGENTSMAMFGHFTYSLTPATTLSGGLRYTDEKRKLNSQQFNGQGCNLEFINTPPCETQVSESFDDWTYSLGLDYHWTDKILTYVSLSRGFKSGGFVARATREKEFEPFDPETVDNLELGFKSILFNDRVRLNLGLFYSDYKNIQRSQLIAIGNDIATTVKNAASATVSGGELLLSLYPSPWLEFSATAGLTIADYDDFVDIDDSGHRVDKSNLDFPHTPRENFSLLLRYTIPDGILPVDGLLSLQADYAWQSAVFHNIDNTLRQDDYGILNYTISYEFNDDLMLSFIVKNATEKFYTTGGLDFLDQFGYSGAFLGAPRSYLGRLTWRF